jgi:hypothetical protein
MQRQEQMVGMPWLGHILKNARLIDPVDNVMRIGIARDNHADHIGPALLHQRQKLHPAAFGHALVAQDHLYPMLGQHLFGLTRG